MVNPGHTTQHISHVRDAGDNPKEAGRDRRARSLADELIKWGHVVIAASGSSVRFTAPIPRYPRSS